MSKKCSRNIFLQTVPCLWCNFSEFALSKVEIKARVVNWNNNGITENWEIKSEWLVLQRPLPKALWWTVSTGHIESTFTIYFISEGVSVMVFCYFMIIYELASSSPVGLICASPDNKEFGGNQDVGARNQEIKVDHFIFSSETYTFSHYLCLTYNISSKHLDVELFLVNLNTIFRYRISNQIFLLITANRPVRLMTICRWY